ncbi:MAG: O-antigen ligase family protein [Planctomycetota bacterium]
MGSIGQPEPFKSRFFGPFGAPGAMGQTCAVVLALLLMFRPLRPPVLWPLAGFLAVCSLASMVRSAWLTAALCLVAFAILARPGEKFRLIVSMAVLVIAMLVALPLIPQGEKMVDRMSSLGDVQNDGSFRGRVEFSGYALGEILQKPQGYGLGSTGAATGRLTGGDLEVAAFDNGFLQIPFALGLPGALLFGLGLFQAGKALKRVRPATPVDRLLLRATIALAIGHFMALAVANFFKSDNAIWLYLVTACALAIRPPVPAYQHRLVRP